MNQEMQNSKRIAYIDALKGFAILCVVLGHIASGSLWDPFTQTTYFFLYNIIYSFHMPLFILLSGETFYRAYCSSKYGNGQKKKDRTADCQIIDPLFSVVADPWFVPVAFCGSRQYSCSVDRYYSDSG